MEKIINEKHQDIGDAGQNYMIKYINNNIKNLDASLTRKNYPIIDMTTTKRFTVNQKAYQIKTTYTSKNNTFSLKKIHEIIHPNFRFIFVKLNWDNKETPTDFYVVPSNLIVPVMIGEHINYIEYTYNKNGSKRTESNNRQMVLNPRKSTGKYPTNWKEIIEYCKNNITLFTNETYQIDWKKTPEFKDYLDKYNILNNNSYKQSLIKGKR